MNPDQPRRAWIDKFDAASAPMTEHAPADVAGTRVDADELERLRKAATPGPWLAGAVDGAVAVTRSTVEHGSHDASTFALLLPGLEVWNPSEALANAQLIAAMHHALPALLDELRRLRAVEAAAAELAAKWSRASAKRRPVDHADDLRNALAATPSGSQ